MSHGSAQKRRALLFCAKRKALFVMREVQSFIIFGIEGFCVKDFMKGSNEL